jgi:hypothetical protein
VVRGVDGRRAAGACYYFIVIGIGGEVDCVFGFGVVVFVVGLAAGAASGDEPYAQEGHGAAADELSGVVAGSALEVTVEDGGAENDGEGKEDELHGDDLCGVEVLESPIDVFNLHDSGADQNEDE